MKIKSLVYVLSCSCLLLVGCASHQSPKVLVYMLDGARADGMVNFQIPTWKTLTENKWAKGYHTAWTLQATTCPDVLPASGPNHTTAVTGLTAKKHKMISNAVYENYNGPALPTFMEYLGKQNPNFHSAIVVDWINDTVLHSEHGQWHCISCQDPDVDLSARNTYYLCNMLSWKKCPDAIFVQDNDLDVIGHKSGFYPYGELYPQAYADSMLRFAKALETIQKRTDFPKEDWLIILCAAHGGEGNAHETRGGHSSTIPMLVCGKNIPDGIITGTPNLLDIAPLIYKHFHATEILPTLDGKAKISTLPPKQEKNAKAIPLPENEIDQNKLNAFTLSFSIVPSQEDYPEQTILFSNNGGDLSGRPGMTIYMDKNKGLHLVIARNNGPITYQMSNANFLELGPHALIAGKENHIIVTVTEEGLATFAHQAEDAPLYWISCASPNLQFHSNTAWIFPTIPSAVAPAIKDIKLQNQAHCSIFD